MRSLIMRDDIWKEILTLISLYEKAKREKDEIRDELEQKKAEAERYLKLIKELEKQIDNLKLKNAFLATSGDEEAKERIDRLIREIDKCIALRGQTSVNPETDNAPE